MDIVTMVDELTPSNRCTQRIHPGLDSNWVRGSKVPILAGSKYIPGRSSLSKNLQAWGQEQHKLKIAVVAGASDPYGLVHEIAEILLMLPEQFEAYLFSNFTLESALDSRFHYIEVGAQLGVLSS